MSVLVDTSVWVDHFRHSNSSLVSLMAQDRVMGHPMVLAEIACGTPPAPREQTLCDMALLRQAHSASMSELMAFIEQEKLYGLGCGLVDLALLASACITPDAALWTLDKRLAGLAKRMGVEYQVLTH
jgi:predicted nucleic acid-binding protein